MTINSTSAPRPDPGDVFIPGALASALARQGAGALLRLRVLVSLCEAATGEAYPSAEAMAQRWGEGQEDVWDAIRWLHDHGALNEYDALMVGRAGEKGGAERPRPRGD